MLPAARVSDAHGCPLVDIIKPHVGGPIVPPCFPTVMTGGPPQARISDLATCVGPPDVLAKGAATVLVGGLPAARQTDLTAHGGVVITGQPNVLVGGPTFTARPVKRVFNIRQFEFQFMYGESVFIRSDADDPDFQSKVIASLIRLDSTSTANSMLSALEATGNNVTIEKYNSTTDPFNAVSIVDDFDDGGTPGVGSDSTIQWNPDVNGFGLPASTHPSEQPGSDVILAHELIHSLHSAEGNRDTDPINSDGTSVDEERNTVGLPARPYNDPTGTNSPPAHGDPMPDTTGEDHTENKVRDDYRRNGIPSPVTGEPPEPRSSYYPADPATGNPGSPF